MEKTKADSIASLLPEGLSEGAVEEIASLVNQVITEKVEEEVNTLTTKVNAYLRTKIDELKSVALKELESDSEFVRSAQIFENMKTLFSIETTKEDENSAVSTLSESYDQAVDEISTLGKQIDTLSESNEKLESGMNVLLSKIKLLESEKAQLKEEIQTLSEEQELPFESSEKAVMVSESDEGSNDTSINHTLNEWLTPEVMKFMPITENNS